MVDLSLKEHVYFLSSFLCSLRSLPHAPPLCTLRLAHLHLAHVGMITESQSPSSISVSEGRDRGAISDLSTALASTRISSTVLSLNFELWTLLTQATIASWIAQSSWSWDSLCREANSSRIPFEISKMRYRQWGHPLLSWLVTISWQWRGQAIAWARLEVCVVASTPDPCNPFASMDMWNMKKEFHINHTDLPQQALSNAYCWHS